MNGPRSGLSVVGAPTRLTIGWGAASTHTCEILGPSVFLTPTLANALMKVAAYGCLSGVLTTTALANRHPAGWT